MSVNTVTHDNYEKFPGDTSSTILCQETGISQTTLNDWVIKGYVKPWVPGEKGRSKSHIFSKNDALALRVAITVFLSERGCNSNFIPKLLRVFSAIPYVYSTKVLRASRKSKGVDEAIRKGFIVYNNGAYYRRPGHPKEKLP